ncbi:MAG: hypothetical protein ACYSU0_15515 [Planctomycetota bacterium]|jgi:hypothetical protein
MADDPIRPPRFPYVAALLCAAAVATAGYLWMRHSRVRDVVPEDFHVLGPRPGYAISPDGSRIWVPDLGGRLPYRPNVALLGCYVRLHGTLSRIDEDARASPRQWRAWVQGEDPRRLAQVRPVAGLLESSDTGTEVSITGLVVEARENRFSVFLLHPNIAVDPTESRPNDASILSLVIGATGVFVLAVALRVWRGDLKAWRMTDHTSSRRPIEPGAGELEARRMTDHTSSRRPVTPGVAAQVLFCLERLEQLQTTKPEHAWLWRLRAKVVSFIIDNHGLRDLAKSYVLTDEEKAEIARTDTLLHPSAGRDSSAESDEVRKVRAELRRRLRGLTSWGAGARPRD